MEITEEVITLAEKIKRDREKAIYTYSMSVLMTLPLAKIQEKNDQEKRNELFQNAHKFVLIYLASLHSQEQKETVTGLFELNITYEELNELYEIFEQNTPDFAIEVAKALILFREKEYKRAIRNEFREVRRIRSRNYTDKQIAIYVDKLYAIQVDLGKSMTGLEAFSDFFYDVEVRANFDELLDKGVTAKDIQEALVQWHNAGLPRTSPFIELLDRLLG